MTSSPSPVLFVDHGMDVDDETSQATLHDLLFLLQERRVNESDYRYL